MPESSAKFGNRKSGIRKVRRVAHHVVLIILAMVGTLALAEVFIRERGKN